MFNSESDMRHYEEIEFKKGQARMSGQAVSNGEIVTSNTLPRTGQINFKSSNTQRERLFFHFIFHFKNIFYYLYFYNQILFFLF